MFIIDPFVQLIHNECFLCAPLGAKDTVVKKTQNSVPIIRDLTY